MQELLQTPFVQNVLNKINYTFSFLLSLFGLVGVQELAVIMGMVFATAGFIGNEMARRARRREEREKHQWDADFHAERQRRLANGEALHWIPPLNEGADPINTEHNKGA